MDAGREEAADFVQRYIACSDEEAVAAGEFQENRQ
jgi:hypothetical protein